MVRGTQFSVTRSVNRQSVSKYMIDHEESSFKLVCEQLSSKAIDLEHNRFLILQGEVEQMSLMKPMASNPNEVGLLEYLEDIIGSNQHIEEIEEIEKSLEGINDERIEKTNRVKLSQNELKGMESEKEAALGYLRDERDYMLHLHLLYFIELNENVKFYNQCVEKIHSSRDTMKAIKEKKNQRIELNKELMDDLQ